ncbi:MAG: 4'-phosphopantetheinyl transferase superfamily protein [Pseudomonadota bacterium]
MTEVQRARLPLQSLTPPEPGEAAVWIMQLKQLPVMQAEPPTALKSRLIQRRMGQKFILRLLLGAYLSIPGRDVQLAHNRSGKPHVSSAQHNTDLAFNLSHADDWLCIAVTSGAAIGIDIESRNRDLRWRQLAARYFSPEEADWLNAMSPTAGAVQFLRHWTAREAMIKAMGHTIAGSIGRVVLSTETAPSIVSMPQAWGETTRWSLQAVAIHPELVCHLASPCPLERVNRIALAL